MTLLKDIANRPASSVVERYERIGISRRKGNSAKQALEREGLIEAEVIMGRTNWVKLFRPTDQGMKLLRKSGVKYPNRHGGPEHQYWVQEIAGHMSETVPGSFQVKTEYPIGGGRCADIAIVKNGEIRAAVEVETGKSDWKENIEKCSALRIPLIITAFTNKKMLSDAGKFSLSGSSVRLTTVRDLFNMESQSLFV